MSLCANCGKENAVHYKYCLGCGAELSDSPGDAAPKPPAKAPSPAAPKIAPTVMAEPDGDDGGLVDALATALEAAPKTSPGTVPSWEPPSAESWASAAGGGGFPEESAPTDPMKSAAATAPAPGP